MRNKLIFHPCAAEASPKGEEMQLETDSANGRASESLARVNK